MADADNMVKWIPLVFLIFAVFTAISALYVGGLTDIADNIGEYDRGKYRIGVVMENTVTISGDTGDTEVDYSRRRGAIAEKFLTNQINRGEQEKVGYAIDDGKCYIPRVAGLDGENFGFYIPQDSLGSNDASTNCEIKPKNTHASVPINVVSKNGKFYNKKESVELTVYEID